MATITFFIGIAAGLLWGSTERARLRRERDLAIRQVEWRGGLLAKKADPLCECGGGPMVLSIEPADDPAEVWPEDHGGESG